MVNHVMQSRVNTTKAANRADRSNEDGIMAG